MAVVLEPATPTREQLRSRRHRDVRKLTVNVSRLPQRELDRGRELYPEDTTPQRPIIRGECIDGPRPCPFVSCVHHLYLDVTRNGSITLNFPDLEPDELGETCALDVADRGGETLERVGELTNLTRERIRQVELKAMARVKPRMRHLSERDVADGRRHLPFVLPGRPHARTERTPMTQTNADPYSATAIEAECTRLTAHIDALQAQIRAAEERRKMLARLSRSARGNKASAAERQAAILAMTGELTVGGVAKKLGISNTNANQLLSTMFKARKLQRIGRGVYKAK